jgi:hypothetical protein
MSDVVCVQHHKPVTPAEMELYMRLLPSLRTVEDKNRVVLEKTVRRTIDDVNVARAAEAVAHTIPYRGSASERANLYRGIRRR